MNKKINASGKSRWYVNIFSTSMILSALGKASSWIYRKLGDGFFGWIFTAYGSENNSLENGLFSSIRKKIDLSGRFITPLKRKIAHGIENSMILGFIRGILSKMLGSTMKSYGIFMFSFALYSAIAYLFRVFYFEAGGEFDPGVGITLILMLIASVLMIASRHTLSSAIVSSPTVSLILFNFLGIRREQVESAEKNDGRFNIPFIAGLLFGIASAFVNPLYLLVGIFLLIAAFAVLVKPEIGVVAILTFLPFLPTMALVAAVIYTALCCFIKVMCGKRSLKFDLLDGVVLIFMLLMLGGGFVSASGSSLKPALVYTVFMLGYFLVVNLIRSKEWFMRAVIGVVSSGAVVSLYGLYQNFFGAGDTTWHDADMFADIKSRVVSTFENPNVLAEYLIMVLPLTVALFLANKGGRAKFGSAVLLALFGGCLIYTWSRGAWLGLLIGLLIFFLIYSKNTLSVLLFSVLGIPFLPFVLPESITSRFLSIGNLADSSTSYRVSIWRGVLNMLEDFSVSGIGIGNGAFSMVYPIYSLSGCETAQHAHNLYLQITAELGIIGLVIFIALLFIFLQSSLEFHGKEKRSEKLYGAAVLCGILGVLAQGMTDYIWYNYRVFLMFWMLLGLGAAIRKTMASTAPKEIY